jgi:hypothetical protein
VDLFNSVTHRPDNIPHRCLRSFSFLPHRHHRPHLPRSSHQDHTSSFFKKEDHASFFFPASPAPPTRDSPLPPAGPPLPSSMPARLPCSSSKQSSFPCPAPGFLMRRGRLES